MTNPTPQIVWVLSTRWEDHWALDSIHLTEQGAREEFTERRQKYTRDTQWTRKGDPAGWWCDFQETSHNIWTEKGGYTKVQIYQMELKP